MKGNSSSETPGIPCTLPKSFIHHMFVQGSLYDFFLKINVYNLLGYKLLKDSFDPIFPVPGPVSHSFSK